jgi:hypothetical protein
LTGVIKRVGLRDMKTITSHSFRRNSDGGVSVVTTARWQTRRERIDAIVTEVACVALAIASTACMFAWTWYAWEMA